MIHIITYQWPERGIVVTSKDLGSLWGVNTDCARKWMLKHDENPELANKARECLTQRVVSAVPRKRGPRVSRYGTSNQMFRGGENSKPTLCLCPKCGKQHTVVMWHTGTGTARKYCHSCQGIVEHLSSSLEGL